MTPTAYIAAVLTMENQNVDGIRSRMIDTRTIRMLHALVGMCTETGELQDQFKKNLIYGKPLDYVNLIEEAGDLMFYVAMFCDVLQVSLEQVMDMNIAKLRKRYPDGYSHQRALNRDLGAERTILERDGHHHPTEGSPACELIKEPVHRKPIYDHDLHSHYEREGSD